MIPLAIFSGPWGWLIKWGLIAALAASCCGYVYVRGISHQQDKDALERADAVVQAEQLRKVVQKRLNNIVVDLRGQIHELESNRPFVTVVRSGVCKGPVPGVQPSDRQRDTGADAGAEVPGLSQAFADDAADYPRCYAKLNACQDTVIELQRTCKIVPVK